MIKLHSTLTHTFRSPVFRRPAAALILVLMSLTALPVTAQASTAVGNGNVTPDTGSAADTDAAVFTAGKGVFEYYFNDAYVPVKILPRNLGEEWRVIFTVKGDVVGEDGGCFVEDDSHADCSVPTAPISTTLLSSQDLGAGKFKATAHFTYTMYDGTAAGTDNVTATYVVVRAKTRTSIGASAKKVAATQEFAVSVCISAGDDSSPDYWQWTSIVYSFNKGGSDNEKVFATDSDGCFTVYAALGKSTKATFYAVTSASSKFDGSKSKKITVTRR